MSALSPTGLKENYQRKINMTGPGPRVLVLVIELPTGYLETTVVNGAEAIKTKIDYICENYTNDFFLKTSNGSVRIICAEIA